MVVPLSTATTQGKGILEAPNNLNIKGQAEACRVNNPDIHSLFQC
jgi:hypothetical protein